jgi:hypothetical protein
MRNVDVFNGLKQEQYKADIESVQAQIYALDSSYPEGHKDWTATAERAEEQAQGIFNAMVALLPKYSTYELNEDTVELLDQYIEKRGELEELKRQLAKEVAK